jgi:tRNA(Ile)-lysidine synthase
LNRCPAGTTLLAAVSGGADSTALLAALVSVMRNTTPAFTLRCLHVEHGIRAPAESRGDADFVRERCEEFGVPCTVVTLPPGRVAHTAKARCLGIEAAARLYRRRALLREARRIETETAAPGSRAGSPVRILTAHTFDDFLETALMRMLRGAGPSGLASISAQRGRFLRPLLAVRRADILNYLREKQLAWREDSTNADTRFLRNRVRHRLVPLLNESFPGWQQGLSSLAETQSLAARYIHSEARRRVRWTPREDGFAADAENFFAQDALVREEALFGGIDRLAAGGTLSIKRAGVRRFCAGAVNAVDLALRNGRRLRARREGGLVLLSAEKKTPGEGGFSLLIKAPGFYTLKGVTIEVRPGFDSGGSAYTAAPFFSALLPLALRPAFKDDRLAVKGRNIAPADAACGLKGLWSAVDRQGTAAFINADGVYAAREFSVSGEAAQVNITVQVTKGR